MNSTALILRTFAFVQFVTALLLILAENQSLAIFNMAMAIFHMQLAEWSERRP